MTGDPEVTETLLAMNVEVETFIHDQALEVMRLPEFQTVWVEINQQVHPLVEQVLRGEESDSLQTEDGVIHLSLYPVYTLLVDHLTTDGIDLRQELNVGEDDLWLTLDLGTTWGRHSRPWNSSTMEVGRCWYLAWYWRRC